MGANITTRTGDEWKGQRMRDMIVRRGEEQGTRAAPPDPDPGPMHMFHGIRSD